MNPYLLALFCFTAGACFGAFVMAIFASAPRESEPDLGSWDDAQGPRPRYQPKEMR
jgi:hypothetical protein